MIPVRNFGEESRSGTELIGRDGEDGAAKFWFPSRGRFETEEDFGVLLLLVHFASSALREILLRSFSSRS